MKVDGIVVHHAASAPGARMEDLRRYHVETLGWKDIGYHYVIERDGTLRVGRPAHQVGAHVAQFNRNIWKRTYLLGICLMGNCEKDLPTPQQINTLVQLLAILCKRHSLTTKQVKGHRDLLPTRCPGRYLYAQLPLALEKVDGYLIPWRKAA